MQGEGPQVGRSTLFVRFGACDLRCAWCDSPETWKPANQCRIETRAHSGEFRRVANPLTLEVIDAAFDALDLKRHRFLSLTGGEPLLQASQVAAIAQRAKSREVSVLLETHGLATRALAEVAGQIDLISMDWKLASDVRRASEQRTHARSHSPSDRAPGFHAAHELFLRSARQISQVVVKLVVTPASEDQEIDEMCRRIAACAADTPLVLQPVTPHGPVRSAPSPERLLSLLDRCAAQLSDVRLIPQSHKMLGVL